MVHTLWSYWSNNEKPKIVDYCLSTWKEHLPHWEIRLLTPKTLPAYWEPPEGFDKLNEQTKNDLIRLGILYDYGGVWLDPDVAIRQNLDWLLTKLKTVKHFTGFRKNWNKYMEDWCIAVVKPRDPLIRKWYLQLYEASINPKHPAFSIEPVTEDPKTCISKQIFYYLTITDQFFAEDVKDLFPSSIESLTGSHRLHKYTENSLNVYSNLYGIFIGIFILILILCVILFLYQWFKKRTLHNKFTKFVKFKIIK